MFGTTVLWIKNPHSLEVCNYIPYRTHLLMQQTTHSETNTMQTQ